LKREKVDEKVDGRKMREGVEKRIEKRERVAAVGIDCKAS